MNLLVVSKQIVDWAEKRDIIKGSQPKYQMHKLLEEFGELAAGVARDEPEIIADSIGDTFVVAVILGQMTGLDFSRLEPLSKMPAPSKPATLDATLFVAEWVGRLSYEINRGSATELVHNSIMGIIHALYDCAFAYHTSLLDCAKIAYAEIKSRKGIMVDGVFVKETDIMGRISKIDAQMKVLADDGASEAEVATLSREALRWSDLLVKARR